MTKWMHDVIDPYGGEDMGEFKHTPGRMLQWKIEGSEPTFVRGRQDGEPKGVKHDSGKPPIYRGVFMQFPLAVAEVARASAFGSEKYSWDNHNQGVGQDRYADALLRHLLEEAVAEEYDDETGLHHAAHVAWNALVRLELILREIARVEKEEAACSGLE